VFDEFIEKNLARVERYDPAKPEIGESRSLMARSTAKIYCKTVLAWTNA
jgi:hypothetical protein